MRLAVFVERDGILNRVRVQNGHPISPLTMEEFEVNLEALGPVRQLKAAGFLVIATTNQPELSRGHLLRRELDAMHALLRRAFHLDDILVCPHEGLDHCPCRKPRCGLLKEAAFRYHIDLGHSFVVSDRWQDAEAARLAGCTSLLLNSPWIGHVHHDFVLPDLGSVVHKIMELSQARYFQAA